MKPSAIANKLPLILSYLAALIIVILPFHAFLTVWLSSAIGNYTPLRLWKEFLLVIMSASVMYLLLKDALLRKKFRKSRLMKAIGAYLLLSLVWGVVSYVFDKVTLKSLGFGLIINMRFLVFFVAIWVIAAKSQWLKMVWAKLVFIPAAIVVLIGLMQRLILPYDILKHFGYSEHTIFPFQTINHDINYPRIMSTLRGANPLGAYLILILSGLAASLLKSKSKKLLWGLLGAAGLMTLFFSYSRGAWIGLSLSAVFLVWLSLKSAYSRKLTLVGLAWVIAVSLIFVMVFWSNTTFQNYFFHTSDRSTVEESSNEEHLSAKRTGLNEIVKEPLGRGIGTAGPASVYNGQARIADNYFIQIAQEAGWLGLALFLLINILVVRGLWLRRNDTLARILLASFVGLTAANMVSHAWTDDTLSYIWWGLAGIALAPAILTGTKHKTNEKAK